MICDECGSKLVVVGLDPVELDLQEDVESESGGLDSFDFDDDRY